MYPLAAGQFTHLPEGTALSQDGYLHARDGLPLMGFRLAEERLLSMLVDTRSTSAQAVQHQKGLDVFRPAEIRLRLLTACLLGATSYTSCRALMSSVYFGCVAPCAASVHMVETQALATISELLQLEDLEAALHLVGDGWKSEIKND